MFRCGNALIIKVVTIVPVREALPLKQGLRHLELIYLNSIYIQLLVAFCLKQVLVVGDM